MGKMVVKLAWPGESPGGMSNRRLPKVRVDEPAAQNGRRLWLPRLWIYVGASLGALVLAVAVLLLVFGGAILNGYGKGKVERAFARAYPGYALQIGELDYAVMDNRLVAQSVTLTATHSTLRVKRASLAGVRWPALFRGKAALADSLANASLDATNLEAEFPQAHYRLRCAQLRASVPGSELSALRTEFRPWVEGEAFFAAHLFRTTRFNAVIPEWRVTGLAYGELLQGKSWRARSIHISGPVLDALVNRDKPPEPFVKSPRAVHEALAAIGQPLQIGSLSISNGHIRYGERLTVGADPALLTIGSVSLSAEGIANRGEADAAIQLRGQGDLMEAGTMTLQMSIPITPPNLALRYSGSLGAMDLTRFNAFLDIAEHIRIKSGSAQEVTFEIDVIAGQARGRVHAIYKDLEVAVLNKQTGTEKGLDNRVASFLANLLKIRNANVRDASGSIKEGKVNYRRQPQDEFQQLLWFALRSGVLDVISH